MSSETVLTFTDLQKRKHWPYTRQHTARMVKEGRFPRPFKMPGGGVNLWRESDIDAYFAERAREAIGRVRP